MTAITLSVVIPTLELDTFLHDAVNSVVDDIAAIDSAEVVIVRDGPQMDVPEWIASEGLIRVIFTGSRGGAARAINLGIRSSDSTYIGRLDADDLWASGRAQTQIALLDADDSITMVAGAGLVIDETGTTLGTYPAPASADIRRALLDRNPIIHSSVMLRRSDWERVGGYDESLIRMQDYDLWLRLAIVGGIGYSTDVVVKYRAHAAQTSRQPDRFLTLMNRMSTRRLELARALGSSGIRQHVVNGAYTLSQFLRYARVRKPGYLTRMQPVDGSSLP